jgi:hypothetical protein
MKKYLLIVLAISLMACEKIDNTLASYQVTITDVTSNVVYDVTLQEDEYYRMFQATYDYSVKIVYEDQIIESTIETGHDYYLYMRDNVLILNRARK